LNPNFENLRVLPSAEITVAGELPGLAAMFTGVSEYWGPENELVVATHAGLGVVMLATAPAGQLAHLQADLDVMLDTLTVPQ
jgi:hypothetical protein